MKKINPCKIGKSLQHASQKKRNYNGPETQDIILSHTDNQGNVN